MVTAADVRNAYLVLLGRSTEQGWRADGWLELPPMTILRNLLSSVEFEEGIARPLVARRRLIGRYRGTFERSIREWSASFFDLEPETVRAVRHAPDWYALLAALFADKRVANAAGRNGPWTWSQLSRRAAGLAGQDSPTLIASDLVERIADGLRLIALSGLARAGGANLAVCGADATMAFEPVETSGALEMTFALSADAGPTEVRVERADGKVDRYEVGAGRATLIVDVADEISKVVWVLGLLDGATVGIDRLSARSAGTTQTGEMPSDTVRGSDPALVGFVEQVLRRTPDLMKPAWLRRFGIFSDAPAAAIAARGNDAGFRCAPLFDASWLREQSAGVPHHDARALEYYLAIERTGAVSPNPFFLPRRYLAANPRIAAAVRTGQSASALEHLASDDGNGRPVSAPAFDPHFYRSGEPLALDGVDPGDFGLGAFSHYVVAGWREGRRPNRVFDADWFERHAPPPPEALPYPNAFSRYLHGGAEAERFVSPFYDPVVYLASNPDLAAAARNAIEPFDPLTHFVHNGRFDSRRSDGLDIGRRIAPYFLRELPDATMQAITMNARDALLTLATPEPAYDEIGEAVWRHGDAIRSVSHGGEIVAFTGQRITFHISGAASMPGARLADVRLHDAPFLLERDFVSVPLIHEEIAFAALSGPQAEEAGYCAWFTLDLGAVAAGRYDLPVLFAFERDGLRRTFEGPVLTLKVVEAPMTSTITGDIQVLMASYNPQRSAFRGQVNTILAQDVPDRSLSLLISDDASSEAGAALVREVTEDPRVVASSAPSNLGFVQNFERAAMMRSPSARLLLFADQDDLWFPDKIRRLIEVMDDDAVCAFSDMRVVDPEGSVIAPSFWGARAVHYDDPISLAVANAVTGAASIFTSDLAAAMIPFPRYVGLYHDQWLAVLATAMGRIGYVDAPLYDYVQHGQNVLGFAGSRESHAGKWHAIRKRLRAAARRRDPASWDARAVSALRSASDAVPELLQRFVLLREALNRLPVWHDPATRTLAQALCAMVSGGPVDLPQTIRTWRRLKRRAGSDPALIGIDYRMEAILIGFHCLRTQPSLLARVAAQRIAELDARAILAGRMLSENANPYAEKIAPIPIVHMRTDGSAPLRINMLLPEINPKTFFGGYYSKIALIGRLIERGYSVRLILVDEAIPDFQAIADVGQAFPELIPAFEAAEIVAAGTRDTAIAFTDRDALLATTWWSAHIADAIRRELGQARFTYLIQEYEPFTFSLGTWYRGAEATYALPHTGIYSTDILRQYFVAERIGQFADGETSRTPWLTFDNPIVGLGEVQRVAVSQRTRRIVFYARPQPHAARNMFEFGVESLKLAVAMLGDALAGWDIVGVGADAPATIDLGGGQVLTLMRKLDADGYRRVLASSDVGLALMYTPHPSLVPVEMAAAGLVTVTNACMTKTSPAMAEISPDLIVAPPEVSGIADAIAAAVRRALAADRTAAPVCWPTTAAEAFPDAWLDALAATMEQSLTGGAITPAASDEPRTGWYNRIFHRRNGPSRSR